MPTRSPEQKELFRFDPTPGFVFINDHVYFSTEGTERVIFVHGVVFAHHNVADRAAEAYAMVSLFETGYASQNDIARAFRVSTRSLRRYQERLEAGGLAAITRPDGRPSGGGSEPPKRRQRDQTILRLKAKGFSNRAIAGKLGLDEKIVRRRLRHLGWRASPEPSFTFLEPDPAEDIAEALVQADARNAGGKPQPNDPAGGEVEPVQQNMDLDPLDRSMDRLLAAVGLLDDATPLFAKASSVSRAGVLLAVPSLVASGLLSVARKIFGSIGPAFYGLRTALVAYILLALLRIPRPEKLKEYAPNDLGRIVGLDRMPEVKTLRRKLSRLASLKGSRELGREMAIRRIRERGRLLGFLYVDGHVRAYHGKHTIDKGYDTRRRLVRCSTL